MVTLILDNRALELAIDGQALALYESGERRGSLPLKLLDRVVLQGDLTLSAGVLTRLAENGTAILMLSKRHSRRLAVVLGPAHNDAAIRLAQAQAVADELWCAHWALRQVRSKLRAQARLIRQALTARPDCHKALSDTLAGLQASLAALTDPTLPVTVQRIRGLEGAAARVYFQGLSALFPPGLGFTGRNRRPPRDPVNACLSLAYTLLHFDAVRAAHTAGLDPLLGFYHRPAFGRESLASDLIEPLRPLADAWVWQLFRQRQLREDHFWREQNACLLGKTGREIFYTSYETFAAAPRRLLRRQCRLLTSHFRGRGAPLLDHEEEDWA